MSKTLGWGVISTGHIARSFATSLPASSSGKLVAVASRSRDKAEAFAREFGAEHAFGSYDGLLACEAVDAVYVATPHPDHASLAVRAARAKKHVLCEKPLGMNARQVELACAAAREHGVLLMEAFMYRSHPQTKRILEVVRSGALGRVRAISASFGFYKPFDRDSRLFNVLLGGGGILDVGCYPISFVRLIAGAALGRDESAEPELLRAAGCLHPDTGVDEVASASLRFPQGIIAQVAAAVSVPLDNAARIFGSEGMLEVPLPWAPARLGGASEIVLRRGGSEERITIEAPQPLFCYEVDELAALLPRTEPAFPAMSFADSLGNARALDAWLEQAGVSYGALAEP